MSLFRIYFLGVKMFFLMMLLRIVVAEPQKWVWRLAALASGIVAVLVWSVALASCQPKPKPAAPPVTNPLRVDTTRQQLEQKARAAKDTLQTDRQKSESAVTNYQNAAADYDASRVQIP